MLLSEDTSRQADAGKGGQNNHRNTGLESDRFVVYGLKEIQRDRLLAQLNLGGAMAGSDPKKPSNPRLNLERRGRLYLNY